MCKNLLSLLVSYLWNPEMGCVVSGRYSVSRAKKPPYSGIGRGRGCGTSMRVSCGVAGALPGTGISPDSGHRAVCRHKISAFSLKYWKDELKMACNKTYRSGIPVRRWWRLLVSRWSGTGRR